MSKQSESALTTARVLVKLTYTPSGQEPYICDARGQVGNPLLCSSSLRLAALACGAFPSLAPPPGPAAGAVPDRRAACCVLQSVDLFQTARQPPPPQSPTLAPPSPPPAPPIKQLADLGKEFFEQYKLYVIIGAVAAGVLIIGSLILCRFCCGYKKPARKPRASLDYRV